MFSMKNRPANSTDRIWLNLVKEILFSKEYEESIDFLNEKENHSCKCVLENRLSFESLNFSSNFESENIVFNSKFVMSAYGELKK